MAPSITQIALRFPVAIFFFTVWLASLTLVILLAPYRCLVRLLARVHQPELTDFISGGMNAFFASSKNGIPTANVCIFLILDGRIHIRDLQNLFLRRVLEFKGEKGFRMYSRLRQHLTTFLGYGFYKWDRHWDLRKHVRKYDYDEWSPLPSPFNEKQLEEIVRKLAAIPWLDGQSPWECLLCDNFETNESVGAKSLLILRISHGLADGYCVQDMLLRLTDSENVKGQAGPRYAEVRNKIQPKSLVKNILMFMGMFYDLAENYIEGVSTSNLWQVDQDAPRELCTAIMPAIPIETVKCVKEKYGISYSAVLMAALGRGFYRIMILGGQNPVESLGCLMPLPKHAHPGGLTNHLYAAHMKLPLISHQINSATLKDLSKRYEKSVKTLAPVALDSISGLIGQLPQFMALLFIRLELGSVAIGNFPVLAGQISIQSMKVSGVITSMALLSPHMRFGATVSMGGADGKQRITVNVNKSAFPNHQVFGMLGEIMEEEILMLAK